MTGLCQANMVSAGTVALEPPSGLAVEGFGWTADLAGKAHMARGTPGIHETGHLDVSMMKRALNLARQALEQNEVPVGAVITYGEKVLSEAFNLRETLHDPTAHAERLAITRAGEKLGSWRLEGCTLYVTLEPCVMCAGAIVLSRIPRVVYGAADPKAGGCASLYRLLSDRRLNHRATLVAGVLEQECREILSLFFQDRRAFSKLKNNDESASEGCLSG